MISIQNYVHRGQSVLRKWLLEPAVHTALRVSGYVLAGFCLSASSLAGEMTSLALAFVCGCGGWSALLASVGAAGGYLVFWGSAGHQAMVWVLIGAVLACLLGFRRHNRQMILLMPALASLVVSVSGLFFRPAAGDVSGLIVYLLRVTMAFGGTWLWELVAQRRGPILDWVACGCVVFSLAQMMPIPYVGLGYIAAGALTVGAPFPVAALAGLALDLAQITQTPMTAVTIFASAIRFFPRTPGKLRGLAPGIVYLGILWLGSFTDLLPLPGLIIGGILGSFLPLAGKSGYRKGETGVAQVRLEMAAGVLSQTSQLLLEVPPIPVDEDALVDRAVARACGSCPYRKNCKDTKRLEQLSGQLLHKPLLYPEELSVVCRKSGRLLTELRRSQEQLSVIQADRQRQAEYRAAVFQQYGFLSDFLQDLSDQLARRVVACAQSYTPSVEVYGNRPETDNGDKCLRFSGTGGRYYVLLCDGMGTGMGAIEESRLAADLLRRMLLAGFPAEYALRSLNSLCALRERAAAVTIDLAEIYLDTGKTVLYKWGAAPSYLISRGGTERIGAVTPPPGLSVGQFRETACRITLRREQRLILASDGVDAEDALRCCTEDRDAPGCDLATRILAYACRAGSDDATVVIVSLKEI